MKCRRLTNKQGTVLVFTTLMLLFLLIMGGIAIELTQLGAARAELQRTMDASALAGAGKLGFDATVFPTARQFAQQYGTFNPYRGGTVNLDLNPTNAANGDIVLGIMQGGAFTPSLDGSQVNAVRCQFATQIPTAFLRLLGFNALPVSAQATAISNPPENIPPNTCVFPIALSCCAFNNCGTGTSIGCGSQVTFITSSGKEDCIAPPCTNTASWANLCGSSTPSVPQTKAAIEAAADGLACNACNTDGSQPMGTNNGMQQAVFDTLEAVFLPQYNDGGWYTITDSMGATTYSGPGWKVFVPVIGPMACPTQAINGPHQVYGWTEFVMTAVVNHGTCVPSNPADPNLPVPCPDTGEPAMRAVFGYYSCTLIDEIGGRDPGLRSALGTGLRLVQ